MAVCDEQPLASDCKTLYFGEKKHVNIKAESTTVILKLKYSVMCNVLFKSLVIF